MLAAALGHLVAHGNADLAGGDRATRARTLELARSALAWAAGATPILFGLHTGLRGELPFASESERAALPACCAPAPQGP